MTSLAQSVALTDFTSAADAGVAATTSTACFTIVGLSDPHLLSRVLEPFAKRGLVPSRCHAVREGEETVVDLQMADMDMDLAALAAASLRQIVGVTTVLTSERQMAR